VLDVCIRLTSSLRDMEIPSQQLLRGGSMTLTDGLTFLRVLLFDCLTAGQISKRMLNCELRPLHIVLTFKIDRACPYGVGEGANFGGKVEDEKECTKNRGLHVACAVTVGCLHVQCR